METGSEERLRGDVQSAVAILTPGQPAVVAREWCDTVQLDREQVGWQRLCLAGLELPAPAPEAAADALAAGGWETRRWGGHVRAQREGCTLRLDTGCGSRLLTLLAATPVVFDHPERGWQQPQATYSLADGVLCHECNGWTVCNECGGQARLSGGRKCWCAASNAGPGRCGVCHAKGSHPAARLRRERHRRENPWEYDNEVATDYIGTQPDPDAFEWPPTVTGFTTETAALADLAQRQCPCGEFRALWRHEREQADGYSALRFIGDCKACAAIRAHAYELP
ncbi:hypothetical protein [Streptacidiphilus sp. MAP5-3]|uniref:hypothetical protein n=1 Tax=unclassified Streptacidiphilus TaxID=2643834 RepID=UPI003512FE90